MGHGGGGGYIKVVRLQDTNSNFLNNALNLCSHPMSEVEGNQILEQLKSRNLISDRELRLIKSAISNKSLNNPINIDNILRANILKQIIIELIKGE